MCVGGGGAALADGGREGAGGGREGAEGGREGGGSQGGGGGSDPVLKLKRSSGPNVPPHHGPLSRVPEPSARCS